MATGNPHMATGANILKCEGGKFLRYINSKETKYQMMPFDVFFNGLTKDI